MIDLRAEIWPRAKPIQNRRTTIRLQREEYDPEKSRILNPLDSSLQKITDQEQLMRLGYLLISKQKVTSDGGDRIKEYMVIKKGQWDWIKELKETNPIKLQEFPEFIRVYKQKSSPTFGRWLIYEKSMEGKWIRIFRSEVPQRINLN